MFNEGDFLRHRGKPEWGTGKVVAADADKIQLRFSHGPVTLKLAVAGPMLEAAPAPPVATSHSRGPYVAHRRRKVGSLRGLQRTTQSQSMLG